MMAVVLTAGVASASPVQGTLGGDTTWSAAGSPYTLTGDVTVPAGVTLTVEPGAVVIADTQDALKAGVDTARVELTVQGTLKVKGTAAQPATFRTVLGAAGIWYGIVVGAGVASSLEGAVVRDAVSGVSLVHSNASVDVSASLLTHNLRGATSTSGVLYLDHTRVTDNVNEGVRCTSICRVDYTTLAFNGGAAFDFASARADFRLTNSIVSDNTGGVLLGDFNAEFAVSHNVIHGGGDPFPTGSASKNIFFNPLFVSASNPRITSNSPARFAASDGFSDVGALPYAGDATPELEGYLHRDTTLSGEVVLKGDLVVPPGITLTLLAGTTLKAAATDGLRTGLDPERTEILVRGALRVQGSADQPVTLQGASAVAGSWYGLRVVDHPDRKASTLERLIIRDAVAGLTATHAELVLSTSTFTANVTGLQADGDASVELSDAQVTANTVGVSVLEDSDVSLTRAQLRGNTTGASVSDGVRDTYGGGASYLIVLDSLLTANTDAVTAWGYGAVVRMNRTRVVSNTRHGVSCDVSRCELNSSTLAFNGGTAVRVENTTGYYYKNESSVTNCILTSNGNYGISVSGIEARADYNDVWDNRANYQNLTAGAHSLSADPLFLSSTDLRLRRGSPCVGKGENGISLGAHPDYLALARLVVSPALDTVPLGTTQAFSVGARDSDGLEVALAPATWTSTGLGAITAQGVFTAGSQAGAATVTVSAEGLSTSFPLALPVGPVARITLTPEDPEVYSGGVLQFEARAEDAFGNAVTTPPEWSALPSVGSISSTGVLRAQGATGHYPDAVRVTVGGMTSTTSLHLRNIGEGASSGCSSAGGGGAFAPLLGLLLLGLGGRRRARA